MQVGVLDRFLWLRIVMLGGFASFAVFLLCMPLGAVFGKRRGRTVLRSTLALYLATVVGTLVWANASGELTAFGQGVGLEIAFQMGVFLLIGMFTAYNFASRYLEEPQGTRQQQALGAEASSHVSEESGDRPEVSGDTPEETPSDA